MCIYIYIDIYLGISIKKIKTVFFVCSLGLRLSNDYRFLAASVAIDL